jgi:hypothetical protein
MATVAAWRHFGLVAPARSGSGELWETQ